VTYVIAEVGINHNGDISLAKKLIDKASSSGCDAVKFQKRTIDIVYTKEELDKPRESPWGTTNREQKQALELSIEEHQTLKEHTDSLGMDYIISCWDENSIQEVSNLDVSYHKVASAMLCDTKFLQALNDTNKPVILSVGMSTQEQIDKAVSDILNLKYILCCTSTYPTSVDELNLKHISYMKNKYPQYSIGFSNHYNGHDACISAVAMGAECIEFHITHDRTAYGSDQAASIQNSESLLSGIRNVEKMLGDGIKKIYSSEIPIIEKLRRVK